MSDSERDVRASACRVLVVDDNVDAADVMSELLSLLGASARAVYSAEGALETAAAFDPELVLVDLRMPDMSGAVLAKKLRRSCDARIIAITGHDPDHVADELSAGAFDGCLTKPCSLEALRRTVLDT